MPQFPFRGAAERAARTIPRSFRGGTTPEQRRSSAGPITGVRNPTASNYIMATMPAAASSGGAPFRHVPLPPVEHRMRVRKKLERMATS